MREGCQLATSGKWEMSAANPVGASVGDRVRLELAKGAYLSAGFVIFILPLLLMIAFYFAAETLIGGVFAVIAAFIGLTAGIAIAYVIGRGKSADHFRYNIVEIVSKNLDARQL